MNDLQSIDWGSTASANTSTAKPSIAPLPKPVRQNNPFSATSPSKQATADPFASLLEPKKKQTLSLAEQAALKQQETATLQAQDLAFFDAQLFKSSLPKVQPTLQTETTDDILADINGARTVNKESYYPPPISPAKPKNSDDDDILGDLARPFRARDDLPPPFSKPRPRPVSSETSSDDDDDEDLRRAKAESLLAANGITASARNGKVKEDADPRAPFIRQIVEMGFTPSQAKVALANTDTGLDVNAAMELLLELQGKPTNPPLRSVPSTKSNDADWVDSSYAVASKTFASANKWLANKSALARRKLAEYSEPTSEPADNRPKWMRDAERYERREKGKGRARDDEDELREEGLPVHPQERRRLEQNGVLPRRESIDSNKSGRSLTSILSIPETLGRVLPIASESRRFKNDDDAMITSSSRRRREPKVDAPTPKIEIAPIEEDLFGPSKPREVKPQTRARPVKPQRPVRQLPYLDAAVLAASSQHRIRGSDAFKRGDFAKALMHYDTALSSIPPQHPVRILTLTNRALTQIQVGAAKLALQDCEEAIAIVGPGKGADEFIDDGSKTIPMLQIWTKAMHRKAIALEMQEQTASALLVWQDLVRSGHGGPSAMEAKQRCEKILRPPAKVNKTASSGQASAAAVRKLRAQNDEQSTVDAERDALYTVVHTKLDAWSNGKEQNIRSLLSSLPNILTQRLLTTWKPVTLADLITTAKVKIIYMKALSKVHPDKIPQEATTEERMISAGVFMSLNKAWDAFKAQNSL